jgi:hypothetical protein
MSPRQTAVNEASSFVDTLNTVIIFPTIALLSAVALLVFIWGCFEYFINASNEEGRRKGVSHITWGIIGLVVMLSAFTILQISTATFGLDDELTCADDPNATDCENVFRLPETETTPSGSENNEGSESGESGDVGDGGSESGPPG